MARDFIQLKQSLRRWLGLSTAELDDETAGEIINLVVREYCRMYESRFSEKDDTLRTRVQIRDYPLPEGWTRGKSLWYPTPTTGGSTGGATAGNIVVLQFLLKDEFDAAYPSSGLLGSDAPAGGGSLGEVNIGDPLAYTVWAANLQFGPVPNSVFTIFRNYWCIPPDLTDAEPTNEFTKHAWEYLLYRGLVKASEFGFEDARVPMWQTEADRMELKMTIEDGRAHSVPGRSMSEGPAYCPITSK